MEGDNQARTVTVRRWTLAVREKDLTRSLYVGRVGMTKYILRSYVVSQKAIWAKFNSILHNTVMWSENPGAW